MLLLLFGVTVPAFAQEEHHQESAKPAQHEEQAKPAAKQEQAKPQKQEQQAKPAKQEQAKPEKQQQEAKPQKQAETQRNQEKSQQHQQQANGHAQQSQGQYARSGQKDRYGHESTKVILVLTIMPALRKMVGATTTDAGSTLTAAIGSMQEHIRRGFTSRTCTSFWERMGYGMQLHTATLL
jgi:outer membrane biosynthesis protein TonB